LQASELQHISDIYFSLIAQHLLIGPFYCIGSYYMAKSAKYRIG
jgi:hypothetical protein